MTTAVLLIVAALIVWLNVADVRRRRALTPAQRVAEDENTRIELSIW
jgi:hypothetical protein